MSNEELYEATKSKRPSSIVFVRTGDYYETFGNDAKDVASIAGLALLKTAQGRPFVGFPKHMLGSVVPMVKHRDLLFAYSENANE